MTVETEIKRKALLLGFNLVGITSADDIAQEQIEIFRKWLNNRLNGLMSFLERDFEKRFSPCAILPEAESVICAAINYKLKQPVQSNSLKIASYALYPDYHKFIKKKLGQLADYLKTIDSKLKFRVCVDSSPVAEKSLAMRAGLGFIGKNRLLTNEGLGSFLFLGEIITNLKLQADKPATKQLCGKCSKCIDVCPCGALNEKGFDARKCISYLTIEHKGDIKPELKDKMGQHLFGCEECLLACPFNEKTPVCENREFPAKERNVAADDVLSWSEKDFKAFTVNSAMHRTGLDRLKRNALICKKTS